MSNLLEIPEIYKLAMLNLGLDPNIEKEDNDYFMPENVISKLKDERFIIVFSGMQIESKNENSSNESSSFYSEPLVLYSNQGRHVKISRLLETEFTPTYFSFDLEQLKNKYDEEEESGDSIDTVSFSQGFEVDVGPDNSLKYMFPNLGKDDLRVITPKEITPVQIHSHMFEQIAQNYGLSIDRRDTSDFESIITYHTQHYSHNDVKFSIKMKERKRSQDNFDSISVSFSDPNSSFLERLKNHGSIFTQINADGVVKIESGSRQISTLDKIIREIIN